MMPFFFFFALHLCALFHWINTGDKPSVAASRQMEPAVICTWETEFPYFFYVFIFRLRSMSHPKRGGEVIYHFQPVSSSFPPEVSELILPIHADSFSGVSFCPWATAFASHVVDGIAHSELQDSHVIHCIAKLSELVFQLGLEDQASYPTEQFLVIGWLRFVD